MEDVYTLTKRITGVGVFVLDFNLNNEISTKDLIELLLNKTLPFTDSQLLTLVKVHNIVSSGILSLQTVDDFIKAVNDYSEHPGYKIFLSMLEEVGNIDEEKYNEKGKVYFTVPFSESLDEKELNTYCVLFTPDGIYYRFDSKTYIKPFNVNHI